MNRYFCLAIIPLCVASLVSAQDTEEQENKSVAEPIIVVGEGVDPTEPQRQVLVGSRIPRKPVFHQGGVATSTGTRGLVPQSGMDPAGAYTRTITTRDCVTDDKQIGKRAACILAKAQQDLVAGNLDVANARFSLISANDEFSAYERLVAAQWQFEMAQKHGDAGTKASGLERMIDIGGLSRLEEVNMRRGLVALYLKLGDPAGAIEQLSIIDAGSGASAQDLANLAIISRQRGLPAAATMQRAIAIRQSTGTAYPEAWDAFAVTPD